MKIGVIGVGVVGGALSSWLEKNTHHEVAKWDPFKGLKDDLGKSDAIFICIPVKPSYAGQDQSDLEAAVKFAKSFCSYVFIRSTVLPGTNDRLTTISCPEFLTARIAEQEMDRLPVLCGDCNPDLIMRIFVGKSFIMVRNSEAELAKLAHNCFGATKVTFFNMIFELCSDMHLNYQNVLEGVLMSGFINEPHTRVPGPDHRLGYGGACFPENMEAMKNYLTNDHNLKFREFFSIVEKYNKKFRGPEL